MPKNVVFTHFLKLQVFGSAADVLGPEMVVSKNAGLF